VGYTAEVRQSIAAELRLNVEVSDVPSTPARLFLGVLTLLPLACMVYIMWRMSFSSTLPPYPAELDSLLRIEMMVMFANLLIIGLCIVYLFCTYRVPQGKKALWAVVLFMGNVIALPIFWFIYIRPATWLGSRSGP
jgi:hypothetical protein